MKTNNEGKLKRGIIAAILICAVLLSSCAGGGGEEKPTGPVTDTTVAETTAKETTAEETTAEETTAEETIAEETTAEETTADSTTAAETTAPADDTTVTDTTAPADDTTAAETTVLADDTTVPAETDGDTDVTLPDGGDQIIDGPAGPDYGGQEFTFLFLQQSAGGRDYYGGNYLNSDMLTGATIDDAVYKRNRAAEEKYNVLINQRIVSVNDEGDPVDILCAYQLAGDHSFDAIYGWGYKLGACAVEGLLGDLKTLPGVDLTKEYWTPSAVEDLSIDNKLYFSINDITMNKLEWGSLLFFNKKLVEDYDLKGAGGIGDFYSLVKNGTWTYDVYLNAIKAVSRDLDGDGIITKYDVYGLIDTVSGGMSLGQSCGVTLTQKREDGSYALNYYNTKSVDLASKIQEVYSNNKYVKTYDELMQNADDMGNMDLWTYSRSFFAKDRALFCTGTAYNVNEFRIMESEYGILPMPKYDANQKNYISMMDTNASIFAIPAVYRQDHSSGSPERTGTILEYMAYESNRIVLPAYIELTLKGSRSGNDDDKLMLDIIRTNIHYEFSQMMGITSIADNCMEMFCNPASAGSQYRVSSMRLQKELDTVYSKLLSNNK